MISAPFDTSKLKIERAQHHIVELDREIAKFLAQKPFRAVIEAGETPSQRRLTYRVRVPVPKIFSVIIGDVLHNLRASLDLLACELVRLNGASDKGVYFPFCHDEASLDRTIHERHLDRAAPDVVNTIRSLKPYRNGNVKLRAIHDLDIMDKHQTIIPIGDCAAFEGLPPETRISVGPNSRFGPVKDGFAPFSFAATPSLPIGREIAATFLLTFAPLTTALGPAEILPTLKDLAALVANIIKSFENAGS